MNGSGDTYVETDMVKPIYKVTGAQRSTREVEMQARQHPRSTDWNGMSARVRVRLPRAPGSERRPPTPIPRQGGRVCRRGARIRHPSPSAPPPDAAPPLLPPSAPFCSPTASSQHVHSRLARSRLSPSLFTQGPPLPYSLSSPPPGLLRRLSLGRGGGELGQHWEEPGGSSRGGERGEAFQPPLS